MLSTDNRPEDGTTPSGSDASPPLPLHLPPEQDRSSSPTASAAALRGEDANVPSECTSVPKTSPLNPAATTATGDGSPQDVDDRPTDRVRNNRLQQQLQRNDTLRRQLHRLRQRRIRLERVERDTDTLLQRLQEREGTLERRQTELCHRYHTVVRKHQNLHSFIQRAKAWNVVNDCFHIWYSGPFGTINGHRLGLEAPPLPAFMQDSFVGAYAFSQTYTSGSTSNGVQYNAIANKNPVANTRISNISQQPSQQHQPQRRYLFFSSTTVTPDPATNNNSNSSSNNNNRSSSSSSTTSSITATAQKTTPQLAMITIPWNEVNAALGQIVFLLQVVQERSSIQYLHELYPMGSTSRIGVRTIPDSSQTSVYNVYYQDTSFSLFGKRNFNIAINGVVQCIQDASKIIHQRDRTIVLPHRIAHKQGSTTEFQVGGLSVSYTGSNGVEWTRAMKYVVTNVKWLIAYSAKHVDL